MCLAILQPAGKLTKFEALQEAFWSNPDGAGFAYVDPEIKKVKVIKGLMTFKDFIDAFNKHSEHHKTSPFLIHFRIGTSGTKDEANTHPFNIKQGALIHNGVMFSTVGERSDTRVLAETYANRFTYENVEANKDKLNKAVRGNKFCMLYDDGRYQIINERLGDWDEGIWYSNNSYKVWPVTGWSRQGNNGQSNTNSCGV